MLFQVGRAADAYSCLTTGKVLALNCLSICKFIREIPSSNKKIFFYEAEKNTCLFIGREK